MQSRPTPHVLALTIRLAVAGLVLALAPALGCAKSAPDEAEPVASAAAAEEAHGPIPDEEAAAPADTPPELEWDQERMTQLTADLAQAMAAVRTSFRNDPVSRSPDLGQRQSAQQMSTILRGLERHTRSLATPVERGQGADETRGIAKRIGQQLRDANQVGRRMSTNAWTDERIRPAMKLVNEIAPYYGRAPLYDVERMEMLDQGPNPNRRQSGE